MGMIRVGMGDKDLVLLFMGSQWPKSGVRLSMPEAADLYAQLGNLLPEELLNVRAFSADTSPPETATPEPTSEWEALHQELNAKADQLFGELSEKFERFKVNYEGLPKDAFGIFLLREIARVSVATDQALNGVANLHGYLGKLDKA